LCGFDSEDEFEEENQKSHPQVTNSYVDSDEDFFQDNQKSNSQVTNSSNDDNSLKTNAKSYNESESE